MQTDLIGAVVKTNDNRMGVIRAAWSEPEPALLVAVPNSVDRNKPGKSQMDLFPTCGDDESELYIYPYGDVTLVSTHYQILYETRLTLMTTHIYDKEINAMQEVISELSAKPARKARKKNRKK